MQIPLQITMRNLPHSDAMESDIRKKAEKLHIYHDRIMSCRVVIEAVQNRKHQGKEYLARIDLKVPGKEFAVNKHRHVDAYVAIRNAFNALQRQLESFSHKQRGDVKAHEEVQHGKIVRLFEDYGFIEDINGTEYYFHDTHLANNNFQELIVGAEVHFIEDIAGDTLQAHHVIVRNPYNNQTH